jgi:hypothetical protein
MCTLYFDLCGFQLQKKELSFSSFTFVVNEVTNGPFASFTLAIVLGAKSSIVAQN